MMIINNNMMKMMIVVDRTGSLELFELLINIVKRTR